MRAASVVVGVVSLLLVGAAAYWEWANRTSPGPLNAPHVIVPTLGGVEGCAGCHGGRGVPMSEACGGCHDFIAAQVRNRQGLHGAMEPGAAAACATCHAEHTGGAIRLVTESSFRAAGFETVVPFDHARVASFGLSGSHARLGCERCHRDANDVELPPAHKRFVGLSQACVACHDDPHKGTYGADCGDCHGQSGAFKAAPGFRHTDRFALTGAHAIGACGKCHGGSGATSVVSLRAGPFAVRACSACHADPHDGTFGADCARCHGTVDKWDRVPQFKHTAAFPLIGGHAALACKRCHEPTGAWSVAALAARPQPVRTCAECHASPHRPALLAAVAASAHVSSGRSCEACHAAGHTSFLSPPATMTEDQHKATGFPLEAPHDKVACAACHPKMGKRAALPATPQLAARFGEMYPGRPPQACETCHADPHRGQFAGVAGGDRCLTCHAPTRFMPSAFDTARHDKSAFPLTGAHRAVACVTCHKPVDKFVRFVPTPAACSACHADVHKGRFDKEAGLASVNGRSGCERCHTTTSFKTFNWSAADHATWTGYALNAGHARAACADCHKPQPVPGTRQMRWGSAPKACAACHADVHAGQFAVAGVTECGRCHTDTIVKFVPSTFEHQRDSAFKLDAEHVKLACSACHRRVQLTPALAIVRYRPLGTRCQDCHDPRVLGRGKESR